MPENEETKKEQEGSCDTRVDVCEECRTAALVDSFSICLLKNRFCRHALPFGHQLLCRHPHHAEFVASPIKKK